MKKLVTYKLSVVAEVDEDGTAEPVSVNQEVIDQDGFQTNMAAIDSLESVVCKMLAYQLKNLR